MVFKPINIRVLVQTVLFSFCLLINLILDVIFAMNNKKSLKKCQKFNLHHLFCVRCIQDTFQTFMEYSRGTQSPGSMGLRLLRNRVDVCPSLPPRSVS